MAVVRSGVRRAATIVAALAGLVAACGGDVAPTPASPVAGAAAPTAKGFDPGPVRTPAEYLLEPAFATADVTRGELLSLACAACHTFRAGEGTLIGPNLHGVFGRGAATVSGFAYSPALRGSGLVWTPKALDAWLANPADFVAGTTMAFTGYRSVEDRRALIAYLLRATQ